MTTTSWTRRSLIYCLTHTPKRLATRLSSNFELTVLKFLPARAEYRVYSSVYQNLTSLGNFKLKNEVLLHSSRPSYQVWGRHVLSTKKNYPNAGPNTSTVWEVKRHIFKFLFISALHFPSL